MALRATTALTATSSFADDPIYGFRGVDYSAAYSASGVDHVVAPSGGTHTTLASAMASAVSGEVIAVRDTFTDGKLREKVTFKDGVTVQGYENERPEITGYDLLGSGTQCTSPTDDAILGSTLAASGQVYKYTGITDTGYDFSDHRALNVRVNGTPYYLTCDRAQTYSNGYDRANSLYPFRVREDDEPMHNADSYSSGVITDASVINSSNYTNTELNNATAVCHVSPNVISYHTISGANVSSNTITISGSPAALNSNRYSLLNVAKSLVAGTFFFVDNGGSYDLYVHLGANTADNDKVEVSTRAYVFDLPATLTTGITIQGLHLSGASGDSEGSMHGALVRRTSNASTATGVTINNVLFSDTDIIGYNTAGGVWLLRTQSVTINQCTFRNIRNQRGIFLNGSNTVMTDNVGRRLKFERCAFAPFASYYQTRMAWMHCWADNCGHKAHSNAANNYIGNGANILYFGCEWSWSYGYLTQQTSANFYAYFCQLEVSYKYDNDRRTIHPQSADTGNIHYVNCTTLKDPSNTGSGGNLALTCGLSGDRTNGSMVWKTINNIADGLFAPATPSGTVTEASNLITQFGFDGVANPTQASDYDTSSDTETTVANVYTDAANRDWSPASASAPQLTITPQSVSSEIAALVSTFTAVTSTDFDIDVYGNTINKASPAVIGANQALTA